jgi:hypothetical protein
MTVPYNAKLFFLSIFLTLCLFSCAKTVTLKETAGQSLKISIKFQSKPDFLNGHRYFIVYSTSTNIDTINRMFDNEIIFFVPGQETSMINDIIQNNYNGYSHFYNNYFNTWEGIIEMKQTDISLTKGPFDKTTSTYENHIKHIATNVSITDYTINNGTISFTLPISELDISGTNLYISIVTIKESTQTIDPQSIIQNYSSIELITNNPPVSGEDIQNKVGVEISPKATIVSWDISVL